MEELDEVAQKCEESYYEKIGPSLGIEMHSRESFRRKIQEIISSSDNFKQFSREQAQGAQSREVQTVQPKELLSNNPKVKLTIRNYLGGAYYFTTDECLISGDKAFLIEKKHTKGQIPSMNDIKDGVIKMILFSNIEEVKNSQTFKPYPILGLTANDFPGIWTSWGIEDYNKKLVSQRDQQLLSLIKKESESNNFYTFLLGADLIDKQNKILGTIIGETFEINSSIKNKKKLINT
ncbi:MAG: hypothetical protein JXA54_06795 [Candidatus Heimdallarchaeota archaeon]|nr:hypothetical protein [Candidatus Heimdallarchaeota archaeon]